MLHRLWKLSILPWFHEKSFCSFCPQIEFANVHSQQNWASSLFIRRPWLIMNLRINESKFGRDFTKNNFEAFGLVQKQKNRASRFFKRRPRFRHEFTKLKFCHGFTKNNFEDFGLELKQKNRASSLFKRRPWFVTSLRNWNFALVSWKIILQLLTSNRIYRNPFSQKSGL